MSAPEQEKLQIPANLVLLLTEAQPRLFGFLLKRLGKRDQAHEVLQEVNLTICRRADDFVPNTDFMAWAFSISRFQLMAFRQRQSRDRLVFPADLVEAIEVIDNQRFPCNTETDRQEALENCLAKLPSNHQKLITKRYTQSTSVGAIATELGRSANAVSILLHRIREKLESCVQAHIATGNEQ